METSCELCETPLGPETEKAWAELFHRLAPIIAAIPRHFEGKPLKQATAEDIVRGFQMLRGEIQALPVFPCYFYLGLDSRCKAPLCLFWERAELRPVHLMRFFVLTGALYSSSSQLWFEGSLAQTLIPLFRRTRPDVGLKELGEGLAEAGRPSDLVGKGMLATFRDTSRPFGMSERLIWPYWANHLDLLVGALQPSSGDSIDRWYQKRNRQRAFQAAAAFPVPPAELVPLLWDLALGPKSERAASQSCLENLPDKTARLIEALKSGTAESRQAAADWLGRCQDPQAVPPLTAALKKEKNEPAKGAMMGALEQLGVAVEQFLDRDGLLKEALAGLKKGIPEALQWFPFAQLPAVHWADNGQTVEPEVLQWWLVQGLKLKSPEPTALLRTYCSKFNPMERERLGQFVLEAWLAEDVAPISREKAEEEAREQAKSWAHWCQMPGWSQAKKTEDEFFAEFLPSFLSRPKGSAVASKGILGVAGACVGGAAVPVVNRYLKQWYGNRAAQCRALLQMLAWVEHKTATQLLLAVGSRFRTKSIQEEAALQVQLLAERKNWTLAELADRTIPSAGLEEDGVLTLDFGPRQFKATLNDDLEFVLHDGEGKVLKALPDPRQDDDEAKSAEAKKVFSAAKKELKTVLSMQRERLYEAMCTQRAWPVDDWQTYLNRHPIARHLCQLAVWSATRNDNKTVLFRPLPDGSLTDLEDAPVTLQPEDTIRLAHECHVTPAQSTGWREHLKDYDVEPLFEQFGRPAFSLKQEQDDELADFQGHLLEAFKLRGRAGKLGYNRGQTQDGGWFYDYRKRFPTLGLEAVLEFSGNSLPEENNTVALKSYYFEQFSSDGETGTTGSKVSFGSVPPVLLGECWNDLRHIAAEGSGFDPEWEQKVRL
ncbi:MAG TPA: DUF4132 domain-containing protein [Verrucomicrobiae bacterium]